MLSTSSLSNPDYFLCIRETVNLSLYREMDFNITVQNTNNSLEVMENELFNELMPNTVFLFILLVVGIIGNLAVICIYHWKMNGKCGEEIRLFILFLAYSDLVAATCGSSLGIAMNFNPFSFSDNLACKSLWFITTVCVFTSGLILVLVAFHRFSAICRPHRKRLDVFWTKAIVFVVFIFSVIISLPCIFLYGSYPIMYGDQKYLGGRRCGKNQGPDLNKYHMIYDVIVISVGTSGIVLMSGFYFMVGKVIVRQINFRERITVKQGTPEKDTRNYDSQENLQVPEVSNNTSQSDNIETSSRQNLEDQIGNNPESSSTKTKIKNNRGRDKKRIRKTLDKYRFSLMFCIISFLFALSYTPRVYIMLREIVDPSYWDRTTVTEYIFSLFLYRMYILNNVSNMFLYLIFDVNFREQVRYTCLCSLSTSYSV